MKLRESLFAKIIFIMLLLVIPIVIFYSYSYYTSIHVIEEELKNRNLNRISIVQKQIDSNFEQISILLLALSNDEKVSKFKNLDIYSNYEALEIKQNIQNKLHLYRGISSWENDLSVYAIHPDELLKTNENMEKPKKIVKSWTYMKGAEGFSPYFMKHLSHPINTTIGNEQGDLIIEARVPITNIGEILKQLKVDQLDDPFLYHPENQFIFPSSENDKLINDITYNFDDHPDEEMWNVIAKVDKDKYLISYMRIQSLDWILVDYTLLEKVLEPVAINRILFFLFVTVLFILSFIAVFFLYRNVRIPVRNILQGIDKIKDGDYTARVKSFKNSEFHFMITSFNKMAEKIETLIETVYIGEIRYQEMHVKQLQSQINPHFLYNCLFIMKNMAKLKHYKGIEAMSLHLGEYYRYMTKVENKYSTIHDELKFVKDYLEIHVLRMEKMTYKINVPKCMNDIIIPRLLIQPIIENACIHGISSNLAHSEIIITGSQHHGVNKIIIEDNGKGLTVEERKKLKEKISFPVSEESRCGLWNVQQRLKYHFGEQARLEFGVSELGGLKVIMYWKVDEGQCLIC